MKASIILNHMVDYLSLNLTCIVYLACYFFNFRKFINLGEIFFYFYILYPILQWIVIKKENNVGPRFLGGPISVLIITNTIMFLTIINQLSTCVTLDESS